MATLVQSPYNNTWRVVERVSGVEIHITNHDTIRDAVAYCHKHHLNIQIT